MDLSIIVNFFNMRREAPRTLYSLTRGYQQDVAGINYEVVSIDSGSTQPLDVASVMSFGPEFSYRFHQASSPSPAAAINQAVERSSGAIVVIVIDGARILSPGILNLVRRAARAFDAPFVFTLGMHLGPDIQNKSILTGYNQAAEDQLLEKSGWREDGYSLFANSSVALSSKGGFFSTLSESNCFALPRYVWEKMGGLDERFVSPGGGLVNLDFYNRVMADLCVTPVMLLGEATFHQVHGGTATNVPLAEHPWQSFAAEYTAIRGAPYQAITRPPTYLGGLHPSCQNLMGEALRA